MATSCCHSADLRLIHLHPLRGLVRNTQCWEDVADDKSYPNFSSYFIKVMQLVTRKCILTTLLNV